MLRVRSKNVLAAVGQLGHDLAAGMAKVVGAGQPDLAVHLGLDLVVVAPLRIGRHLDGAGSAATHHVEDVADEGRLRLVDVDDRVDPVRVGAVQHKEIGISGDQRAEVGLRAVAPVVAKATAAASVHIDAGQVVGGREPGAVDDGVDAVFDAVDRAHPRFGQLGDGGRFQLHVRQSESGIPLPRHERPLAAGRIVRRQLGPQLGVGHLAHQVTAREFGRVVGLLGVDVEAG